MAVSGFYRDLVGGALGAAQAQMQIEQLKLQRQQMDQQAAAQRSAQDIARQQVLADIIGNTAKGVVGGIGAAQDYQTQQKRLGIEQQQADRQAKLAEAQIAAAELDKQKALADQVQQMARMRLLGAVGLPTEPAATPTTPATPAASVLPQPSSLSDLVQPAASAAAPVPSGVNVTRIESNPSLGLVGQRNAAMARQSMADLVGVSPDLGSVRQDMGKALGVTPSVQAAAAPEAPAAASPVAQKAAVQKEDVQAPSIDTIAQEMVDVLSDDQLKSLGIKVGATDQEKDAAKKSAKGIVRGMLVAENEQRKAVQTQNKRLEMGLIKDQQDVEIAKRTIAKDVLTNAIKNMPESYDPSYTAGLANNPAIAASGIQRDEIDGMAREYARTKNKEEASVALEAKVRNAQIRASDAGAAENRAQAGLIGKQAEYYYDEMKAKDAARTAEAERQAKQMDRQALQAHISNLESQLAEKRREHTHPVTNMFQAGKYNDDPVVKDLNAEMKIYMDQSRKNAGGLK